MYNKIHDLTVQNKRTRTSWVDFLRKKICKKNRREAGVLDHELYIAKKLEFMGHISVAATVLVLLQLVSLT